MKPALPIVCLTAFLAVHCCAFWAHSQTTQPDFELLISQLDAEHPAEVRIKAARALGDLDKDPQSLKAVDALKAGLTDPDDEVRYQSLANLSFILNEHRKECPVEIFALADDNAPRIQTNFPHLLNFFETFPPEGLGFSLTYYEKLKPEEKPDALVFLAKAGGKDKRVMKILFDAVNSNHAQMRANGTAALWAATHDYEILIPLHFDRLADAVEVENLPDGDNGRFTGPYPRIGVQLARLGVGHAFNGQLSDHHDQFVEALRKFAVSRDVVVRQKLSNYLSFCLGHAISESESEFKDQHQMQDCDYNEIRKIAKVMADDSDKIVSENSQRVLRHIETLNRN